MDQPDILISKINEAYVKVNCDPGIARELHALLTFEIPGAKFMPSYRKRFWDGKIRLFNLKTNQIYYGLTSHIQSWAEEKNYSVEIENNFNAKKEFSLHEAKEFTQELNLTKEPRDYQLKAFALAVRNHRGVLISPTASGKSLIIYLITRYYNARTLIIVPTTSLVSQLATDFADYGYESDRFVHRIYAGQDKHTDKQIIISTWQSIYELPKEYFKSFEVIIGDEAHQFKAQSLTSIMTKATDTQYRFGTTGTLDDSQVNELVLRGLFGDVHKIVETAELIKRGNLAQLKIEVLTLNHPKTYRRQYTYQEEVEHIIGYAPRNRFIRNLALSLKGNTLILYARVESHGQILYDEIKSKHDDVFFIHGGVETEEREDVRKIVNESKNSIIVASYGTFAQGINIVNLHNIIFASPTKSRIRTLQSIGRGLRQSAEKQHCKLFDIADNLTVNKKKNYTLNHLIERVKMYNSEQFPYELHSIDLRD